MQILARWKHNNLTQSFYFIIRDFFQCSGSIFRSISGSRRTKVGHTEERHKKIRVWKSLMLSKMRKKLFLEVDSHSLWSSMWQLFFFNCNFYKILGLSGYVQADRDSNLQYTVRETNKYTLKSKIRYGPTTLRLLNAAETTTINEKTFTYTVFTINSPNNQRQKKKAKQFQPNFCIISPFPTVYKSSILLYVTDYNYIYKIFPH